MSASIPTMTQIKNSMRATWMPGDFGEVAKKAAHDAEALVSRIAVPRGALVLDVACGTGNRAVPLARGGAIVTGIDIAPNLLEQARERAAAENLAIAFDEGDAEQLPYPDAAFDVVVSMFGVMFTPRPELVAAEMARVLKPAGLLAMGNWNPASFTAELFTMSARKAPPPPGIMPPILWGDEQVVRERLSPKFDNIRAEVIPIVFDLPVSPAETVAFFRRNFGPTQVAFSRLDEAGQAAFARDLEALWRKTNTAPDPEQHTLVHNQYLQVTATPAESR